MRQALLHSQHHCPFRTLGLPPNCTSSSEVKKRWSKLILLLHPDKAPLEWRSLPELAEAAQAVNSARTEAEAQVQLKTLIRPPPPEEGAISISFSGFGGRVAEVKWQPPSNRSASQSIEKYILFVKTPRQLIPAGTVRAGADPWFVLSEDDQRHKSYFSSPQLEVHIHTANAAGTSSALIVSISLSGGSGVTSRVTEKVDAEAERMFEGLKHLTVDQLRATLGRFKQEQLRALLRTEAAVRLSAPAPPPSGQGSKNVLIERLLELFGRRR